MPTASLIVLYVEDEESDALLMEMAFAKEGLEGQLRVVNNGQAVVDYLSGAAGYANRQEYPPPGVVLLDLNLPEMHGFDVLKWIRAHPLHTHLPVVIFSSSVREEDQARATLLGANDFIQKPNSLALFGKVARKLTSQASQTDDGPSPTAKAPQASGLETGAAPEPGGHAGPGQ